MNDRTTRSAEPLALMRRWSSCWRRCACGHRARSRTPRWSIAWWWLAAVAAWIAWWIAVARELSSCGRMATLLVSLACTGGGVAPLSLVAVRSRRGRAVCRAKSPSPAAIEVRATSGPRRIPAPPPDPLRTIATPDRTRLDVEVLAIRDGDAWRSVSGGATLFVDGHLAECGRAIACAVFGQLGAMRRAGQSGRVRFRGARSRRAPAVLAAAANFPSASRRSRRGSRAVRWPHGRLPAHPRRRAVVAKSWARAAAGLAAAMFLGAREELRARRNAGLSGNRHDSPAGDLGAQRRHPGGLPVSGDAHGTGAARPGLWRSWRWPACCMRSRPMRSRRWCAPR